MLYSQFTQSDLFGIGFLFGIIIMLLLGLFLVNKTTKSSKARELMVDLYVIGKVRQLAAEDKINLEDELVNLKKLIRWNELKHENLNEAIENEMKEKITDKIREKVDNGFPN